MFCQKCGAENKDGSKFCNKCGTQLLIPKPDSMLNKTDRWLFRDAYIDKSKPNFKIASLLAALGVLLLLWSVWVGIMRQSWSGTVANIGWVLLFAGLLVFLYQFFTDPRCRTKKGD
jgi:uncharacterized membrane protein YvbJ